MTTPVIPANYVFEPQVVSDLTVQSLTEAQKNAGYLLTGIPQIDDHYVMHRDTKVNGIIADTSHGKTAIMNIMARNFIALPTTTGTVSQLKEGEIVVYVTWEDSIEDMSLSFLANASRIPIQSIYNGDMQQHEWEAIMLAAIKRAETPLWLMGHSDQKESRRPRLTMTDVWKGCEYIEKRGFKVKAILLDYLQRINRNDQKGDMRSQFMGVMDSVKDLALDFTCDVTIGSQIGRDVADRKWKQPQVHDAQETSNFEQTCDGIGSLWIPKKNMPLGESLIPKKGEQPPVFVTEHCMLWQTLKQKKGRAPVMRAMDYWPEYNEIRSYSGN